MRKIYTWAIKIKVHDSLYVSITSLFMTYFYKRYLIVLICLFSFSASGLEKVSWPFPTALVEQAVFKLEFSPVDDEPLNTFNATGFVVEIEGEPYVVTNFHVIHRIFSFKKDAALQMQNNKGEILETEEIAGLSFLYDLALIKIKKGYKGPALKLTDKIGGDKKAYMMGFPRGQFKKITLIEVSENDSVHLAGLTNETVTHFTGASGSPVFSNKGEVIGVTAVAGDADLGFIKSHFIKAVLKVDRGPYKKIRQWLQAVLKIKRKPYKSLEQWIESEIASVAEMSKNGDPYAQFVMASHFQNNENYYQIKSQKFNRFMLTLYRESASQGHIRAQMELGDIYLNERYGTSQDIEEAKKWLRLAEKNKENVNGAYFLLGRTLILLFAKGMASYKEFLEGIMLLKQLDEIGVKPARKIMRDRLPPELFQSIMRMKASEIMDEIETVDGEKCKDFFQIGLLSEK